MGTGSYVLSSRKEGKIAMVVKKISFVLIVLVIAIVGIAISSAFAADDAARIARRDKMIADLKAEYEAKISGKKVEVTEATEAATEKESEVTEMVAEKKAEIAENIEEIEGESAETIAEAESIATEKMPEVKDTAEAVSGHGTEAAEKFKAKIPH